MNVEHLMTIPVETCNEGQMLDHAARIMWEQDCGAVPVVDHEGRPIAMITDRDLCMASYTQGLPLFSIPVATAMSKKIVTCHKNESIANAESIMKSEQIRRLPIVDDDDRIIGILSLNDIATRGLSLSNREKVKVTKTRDELGPEAIAATLSAICARPSMQQTAE